MAQKSYSNLRNEFVIAFLEPRIKISNVEVVSMGFSHLGVAGYPMDAGKVNLILAVPRDSQV